MPSELLKEIARACASCSTWPHLPDPGRAAPRLSAAEISGIPRQPDRLRADRVNLRPRRAPRVTARQQEASRGLKHLRDIGNTVVVVEHDLEGHGGSGLAGDFGQGRVRQGGEIVAAGHAARS